jgi:hypothetical protein
MTGDPRMWLRSRLGISHAGIPQVTMVTMVTTVTVVIMIKFFQSDHDNQGSLEILYVVTSGAQKCVYVFV